MGWRVREKKVAWTGGGLAGRGEILLDLFWEGVSKYAPCTYGVARAPLFWHNAAKVKIDSVNGMIVSWEQDIMSWERDNCVVGGGYYVVGGGYYVVGTR